MCSPRSLCSPRWASCPPHSTACSQRVRSSRGTFLSYPPLGQAHCLSGPSLLTLLLGFTGPFLPLHSDQGQASVQHQLVSCSEAMAPHEAQLGNFCLPQVSGLDKAGFWPINPSPSSMKCTGLSVFPHFNKIQAFPLKVLFCSNRNCSFYKA